jgi:hypothetical protein
MNSYKCKVYKTLKTKEYKKSIEKSLKLYAENKKCLIFTRHFNSVYYKKIIKKEK